MVSRARRILATIVDWRGGDKQQRESHASDQRGRGCIHIDELGTLHESETMPDGGGEVTVGIVPLRRPRGLWSFGKIVTNEQLDNNEVRLQR